MILEKRTEISYTKCTILFLVGSLSMDEKILVTGDTMEVMKMKRRMRIQRAAEGRRMEILFVND